MFVFELIGLGFMVLFFGALVSPTPAAARR
jgi:hypothetical protein